MEEQFVPYELALKLRELGFDEKCLNIWFISEKQMSFKIGFVNFKNSDLGIGNNYLTAPLWQQVFQWFIKKYKLFGETPMFITEDGLYAHKVVIKDTLDFALYVRYDEGVFPSIYKANIKCIEKLIKIVTQ